jgi:prepilin signal peptidase PulO-like enzyme (type II secretory pathway)
MRSYIPFGPFLVAGAVLVLVLDERLLTVVR